MAHFNTKKGVLVAGLALALSLPLLDGDFSARCNQNAGDATVAVISTTDMHGLAAADDLQGGWKIFQWKVWGYVGNYYQAVGDALGYIVDHFEDLVATLHIEEGIVIGVGNGNEEQQKVLLGELD